MSKVAHLRLVRPEDPASDESESPRPPPLTAAQEGYVKAGFYLIEYYALEVSRCYPQFVTPAELRAYGTFALYEAARIFEDDGRRDFVQFAKHHVRGRMRDSVRKEHLSLAARVEHSMERAYDRFSGHQRLEVNMASDSEETIEGELRKGCDQAIAAAVLAGLLEAQAASPEDLAIAKEEHAATLAALEKAIGTLGPYERQVIRLVYQEEMTLHEVAQKTRYSVSTIQRRHVSALDKLKVVLTAEGVTSGIWPRFEF